MKCLRIKHVYVFDDIMLIHVAITLRIVLQASTKFLCAETISSREVTISSSHLQSIVIGNRPKCAFRDYVTISLDAKRVSSRAREREKKRHRAAVKYTKLTQTPQLLGRTRRSSMKHYIHHSLQKQCDFSQILLGHSHTHAVGINVIVLRAGRGRRARRKSLCFRPRLTFLV